MERDQTVDVGRTFKDLRQGGLDERRERALRVLGVWVCAFIAALCLLSAWLPRAYGSESPLSQFIEHVHRNMRPRYAERAKTLIPLIEKYSAKYEADPLFIGCLFFWESSFRNYEGALGEVGPGHIMPRKWAKAFDLKTLDGQVEASVYRWDLAKKACKSFEGALTHYACGACRSKSKVTQGKIRYRKAYYLRMRKRFEQKG